MTDLELLRDYTRANSQEAFAALVARYVNLVYSAARRQVRSAQLAEEIAQSVFLDLARHAPRLRPDQPLAAWLFLVTRRTAVDIIRRETRRQAREQAAAEIAAMKTPSATWSQVKEIVDEAIAALNETERSALLLRFFENQSLREVGAALGVSEDTAQKRVSRALERLRELLLRRGVAISAAGLATDLSAHAIEAAPATLGATISSAAALSPLAAAASHPVTATLAQKAVATAAAVAFIGAAIYEASAFARNAAELSTLPAQIAETRLALTRIQRGANLAVAHIQAARNDLARLAKVQTSGDPELESAIAAWLARVERLKGLAVERPDLKIPELEVLTDDDWFVAAKSASLETEAGIQAAFGPLHKTAREALAKDLSRALDRYAADHDQRLPGKPEELAPFTERRVSPDLLRRFELLRQGTLAAVPRDEGILAERDEFTARHNSRIVVTTTEFGPEDLDTIPEREVRRALRAYAAANKGKLPARREELLSFFRAPRPAAIRSFLAKPPEDFTPAKLAKYIRK